MIIDIIDNLNTEASLGTADIIVEAITEVLPLKQRLFKQWDQMCPDKTILATNTSFLKVRMINVQYLPFGL